jgi:predicted phage terminase large subunit-like protein
MLLPIRTDRSVNHTVTRIEVERNGLMAFVRNFWAHSGEAIELIPEPHMELVCAHLEACALNGTSALNPDLSKMRWAAKVPERISDLVIAIPPGMSKSKIVSVFFPAWVWTWCPGAKFITTSYADDLAIDFGRQSYDIMRSEDYRACWPHLEIEEGDRAAMSDYRNTRGGRRWSMPMGGKVTGKHGHFLLSDDPIKPDDLKLGGDSAREALSQVRYRWDALFSNRSAHPPTFTRIVIAQRLHTEDLSGHFVKQGAVHLKLPMLFEVHDAYHSPWGSDWRWEEGQLLAPLRFPQSVIDMRMLITPTRDWAAQYQQRPSPEDGSHFQRTWFNKLYIGRPWGQLPVVLSVDSSNKETKGSDYFVCQAWAKSRAEYWLVDQVRARMGFHDQVRAIATMRLRWANVRQILVEEKSNGTAIIAQLQKKFPGVIAINPEGGKEARAAATTWLWQTGCINLPEHANWLGAFIEEHITFPVGSHDDQVDAASQYLNWASVQDKRELFRLAMAVQRKKLYGDGTYRT